MTTFAENPVSLPDGQNSRNPAPEEIVQRGFFPPVQTPDGRVVKGDVLPSGWLNSLLRDAFYQTMNEKPAASIPDKMTTASAAEGVQNWFSFRVGDVHFEIGAFRKQANPATAASIVFQSNFKPGQVPHVYFIDLTDVASAAGKYSMMGDIATNSDHTKINVTAKNLDRSITGDAAVLPGTFLYIAVGQSIQDNRLLRNQFCPQPQQFIDGQSSFAAPSAEQVSFGFAPPILDGQNIVDGDTLPANILNYLLHDIMSNKAAVYWETGVTSGNLTRFLVVLKNVQIQSFRVTVAATPDPTVVAYPWPHPPGTTTSMVYTMAGIARTTNYSHAMSRPVSPTQVEVVNRSIITANAAAAMAGTINILAMGPTIANKVRPGSLVAPLSGFATQSRTYPDGQANKVQPSNGIMSAGFMPTYRDNLGSVIPGDLVTANELNWLFDDLYKYTANTRINSGAIPSNGTTKVAAGYWITIGDMLLQWFTVLGLTAADWTSGVRTQNYPMPFKAGTIAATFAVDDSTAANGYAIFVNGDAPNADNVMFQLTAIQVNSNIRATPGNLKIMAIGKKP